MFAPLFKTGASLETDDWSRSISHLSLVGVNENWIITKRSAPLCPPRRTSGAPEKTFVGRLVEVRAVSNYAIKSLTF